MAYILQIGLALAAASLVPGPGGAVTVLPAPARYGLSPGPSRVEPHYHYKYSVADRGTGDIKGAWEKRAGDLVWGAYFLRDPDGHWRTVHYQADKSGFHAEVKRRKLGSRQQSKAHPDGTWEEAVQAVEEEDQLPRTAPLVPEPQPGAEQQEQQDSAEGSSGEHEDAPASTEPPKLQQHAKGSSSSESLLGPAWAEVESYGHLFDAGNWFESDEEDVHTQNSAKDEYKPEEAAGAPHAQESVAATLEHSVRDRTNAPMPRGSISRDHLHANRSSPSQRDRDPPAKPGEPVRGQGLPSNGFKPEPKLNFTDLGKPTRLQLSQANRNRSDPTAEREAKATHPEASGESTIRSESHNAKPLTRLHRKPLIISVMKAPRMLIPPMHYKPSFGNNHNLLDKFHSVHAKGPPKRAMKSAFYKQPPYLRPQLDMDWLQDRGSRSRGPILLLPRQVAALRVPEASYSGQVVALRVPEDSYSGEVAALRIPEVSYPGQVAALRVPEVSYPGQVAALRVPEVSYPGQVAALRVPEMSYSGWVPVTASYRVAAHGRR